MLGLSDCGVYLGLLNDDSGEVPRMMLGENSDYRISVRLFVHSGMERLNVVTVLDQRKAKIGEIPCQRFWGIGPALDCRIHPGGREGWARPL